jgi:adenine-specific DNA-methyltransferase
VRAKWDDPRPELLRPLLTHKVAHRYRSLPATLEILYPHTEHSGRKCAVDLGEYPVSRAYLESHRKVLESRKYVIEAGRKWYEIWVPQQPSLWRLPKLIWPDISIKPIFWMSIDEELVQGDCYWLSPEKGKEDLLWLALAVANSRFAETFYDQSFNNKLYSGRRRFMTQYVERFPLPDPASPLAIEIVRDAKRIFALSPSDEADSLAVDVGNKVCQAFGVSEEVGW